jgi:hypothetical protein
MPAKAGKPATSGPPKNPARAPTTAGLPITAEAGRPATLTTEGREDTHVEVRLPATARTLENSRDTSNNRTLENARKYRFSNYDILKKE